MSLPSNPRRRFTGAVALAGAAVLLTAPAGAAFAQSPAAAEPPAGLFGDADPSYDGVWRQSVALLAHHTAGYTPAGEAVDWLTGQQCDDGSFLSYRPDPAQPCGDVSGADTNATALAVQALAALGGHEAAVDSALTWLTGVQNADGGWSFNPGGASDANSTALVIGAFAAAGQQPGEVERDGNSPYDALLGFQLGCDTANENERGAFAWQPDPESGDLFVSDLATVDAVLGAYGSGLVVDPEVPEATAQPLGCGDAADGGPTEEATASESPDGADALAPNEAAGAAGAAYLAGALDEGGQHLVSTPPGGEEQADYLATARAVLALSAGGLAEERQGPLNWLIEHHAEWPDYAASPTALGTLVLAAHASGVPPEDFGGTNLIDQLNALGPDPDDAGGANGGAGAAEDDDGGPGAVVWVVGAGLLVGIAIGVVLTLRKARRA
ncbi:prenyltransferase/squalene oxidase repeat-containing protein [Streptomyces litchfieldiae]|uniref:Prenyltransferase/squalene oxidase repeat-containing protein n=1 Tax=Streptomyces litchfieldiae TaxID=3075543 RepID=A0ABU2MXC7_9ACTN|nr:prenyltransferase/squalene oxidase repeat-containing protein [Streptomyces sp. DSM 44938]MDT0346311.1 prenyltransferase/squalene oxidase repeat-containing protein [Streptomyces sp. DSM 44938]